MNRLKLDLIRYKTLHGDISKIKILDYIKLFSPRMFSVFLYRTSSFFFNKNMKVISKLFSLANFLIFKVEISPQSIIGGGLFLPHPISIVIGANKIGNNCTIYQNVTIGAKTLDMDFNQEIRPILGDNVIIATGAVIIGGIVVGDNATIAANSVVTKDVSRGSIVGGVPAKLIDNTTIPRK